MSGGLVRKRHRALVLGVLRSGGPLTKADIARRLGLSVPTITQILRDFEREGAVVPVGAGRSSGGRRPMLYRLRTDGLRAIGVGIDPDRISAVVSDLSGAISAETGIDIDLDDGEDAFESALTRIVDDLLVALGPTAGLAGIGVAAPAMMRRSRGGVFLPIGRPGWSGVDLPAVLGKRFHLPVVAENRAHAVGVGEYLFGAGQGTSDLLCLMLGSGLGAAVLTDGHLFTGGDGAAGAIGRMIVDSTGDDGSRTVSDLVGACGIVRSAAARLHVDGRASLGPVPVDRITVDDVIDAALGGDPAMREILADVGRVLARAIASTLCVTDSRLVLLCGPTLRAGDLVVAPLREALVGIAPFDPPEIRLGRLGTHAGPVGAAALVLTDLVRSDVTAPTATTGPTRPSGPTPSATPNMPITSSRGTGAVAYAHP